MTIRFVILASMRTGSNLLNSCLNQYHGVVCHGEAFNPAFVGLAPQYLTMFGLQRSDVALRDKDPLNFLGRIMGLPAEAIGLHMFPGHDPVILDRLLADRDVRKICLRRSVFHAFVSLQIARKTDVWRVTREGPRAELPLEERKIVFQASDFEDYRARLDRFWHHVLDQLRSTGQTFQPVWYRELNDVEAINRIIAFLGLPERKSSLKPRLDRQNPEPLSEIVVNWDEMVDYARRIGLEHQI
jgi:LPS sulfotransferase NodH